MTAFYTKLKEQILQTKNQVWLIFHIEENIAGKGEEKSPLTHYHTMPHFDALKIYSCGKHCEKRRNCQINMALNFHFKCTLKCRL